MSSPNMRHTMIIMITKHVHTFILTEHAVATEATEARQGSQTGIQNITNRHKINQNTTETQGMELWSSHLPRSGSGKNNLMRRPHLRRRFSFRFHPMWNDFHMFLTAKNPYMILYVSLQPCPSCKLHYSIVANSTSVRFQSPYNTSRPIQRITVCRVFCWFRHGYETKIGYGTLRGDPDVWNEELSFRVLFRTLFKRRLKYKFTVITKKQIHRQITR